MTRISAALFFIVVFFWCSSVIAATHEHHMTTQHPTSPFDQKKEGSLLHCTLKGHPVGQICPEMSSNGTPEQISTDCRDHTSGAMSDAVASSSISLLTSCIRSQNDFLSTCQQINLHNHETGHHYFESIDHPPKDLL